jgi:hypothetical protein
MALCPVRSFGVVDAGAGRSFGVFRMKFSPVYFYLQVSAKIVATPRNSQEHEFFIFLTGRAKAPAQQYQEEDA